MLPKTSTSYLLWRNILTHSSLSASATDGGSHVRNAVDWRTNTSYQVTTAGDQYISISADAVLRADAVAVTRHNIATALNGSRIIVQYFSAGQWKNAGVIKATSDNQTVLQLFDDSFGSTQWRLKFNVLAGKTFALGVVLLGAVTHMPFGMPAGFVPPRHNPQIEYVTNKTDGGAFVGRSIVRKGFNTELRQPLVTTVWLRSEGELFKAHAETKPFIFSWSHVNYPQDAVYCLATNPSANDTRDSRYQNFSMSLECYA